MVRKKLALAQFAHSISGTACLSSPTVGGMGAWAGHPSYYAGHRYLGNVFSIIIQYKSASRGFQNPPPPP
eukprot:8701220-Pyramimonas_sp.AAC.2